MKAYFIPIVLLVAACGSSSEGPKGPVFEANGAAIGGYDPVAYFEQSEAILGDPNFATIVDGVTYQFSSIENKKLFDSNIDKYTPAYGGWCAYAVAESSTKMEPDPTMWQIQDGKLMLFYDDWMTSLTGSLKEEWNTDQEAYKKKADDNWVVVEELE